MTETVLQAKDLHVAFNGIKAADGVNLEIHQGDFLAVIGPNGAGKTTLLNLCTGYIKPHSGRIYLDGKDITRATPRAIARRGVARAFQIPQLFSDLRVIDNVMLALASNAGLWKMAWPLDRKARREEAEELLGLFGLVEHGERLVNTLPEGHRKLLDIAAALALRPRLLLLDEPTSGVSALERFPLMEALMGALREKQVTALFVEHDMDVVERYAKRVLVWNSGNIMAEGTPDEVLKNPDVLHSVVGVS